MNWKDKVLKRAVEMLGDNKGQLPGPREQLELSSLIPNMRTNVRVETHDYLTGKINDLQEGHNFLSIDGQYYLKQIQKLSFNIQNPKNYMRYADLDREENSTWGNLWNLLYLSDSSLPESPATEVDVPGNIIGYANKFPYAGTLSYQGAINQNESFASDDMSRFVWDFGTDRANGIIQSIGLCRSTPLPKDMKYQGGLSNCDQITTFYPTTQNYSFLFLNNGILYGVSSNKLYEINTTSFEETLFYTLPATPSGIPFFFNNFLYVLANNVVYKIDPITGTTISNALTTDRMNYNGTFFNDGTYLYVYCNYFSNYYCQLRLSDLSITINQGYPAVWLNQHVCSYNGQPCSQATVSTTLPVPFNTTNSSALILYKFNTATLRTDTSVNYGYLYNGLNFMCADQNGDAYCISTRSNYYNGAGMLSKYGIEKYSIPNARLRNLITRKCLAEPIIKNNTKTMKVTYDIMYV